MKKVEIILAIFVLTGIMLSLLNVVGASLVNILAFSLLSFFYYVFSFALFNNISFRGLFKVESYRLINTKRILFAVFTGFGISHAMIGILFKIENFPGFSIILSSGIFILMILAILSSYFYYKKKTSFYTNLLIRISIFLLVAIFTYIF